MGTYYKQVEQYLDRIDNDSWVEIGVDRGEGSTRFFADLAEQRGIKFYGVDADPEQIDRARKNLSVDNVLPEHIKLVADKGEDFLSNWPVINPKEKISRVVRMESGNCLVLTYGGDGHKSFSRLSAFLAGIKLYEIYINKDYNYKSWQDDLKKVLLIAGMENKHIGFLFDDKQIFD